MPCDRRSSWGYSRIGYRKYGGIVVNKSDRYYLKAGKLELSMLDDEDEAIKMVDARSEKEVVNGLETGCTKGLIEKQDDFAEPQLKVSKEVYNTLHAMGEFLTRRDESTSSIETKEENHSNCQEQDLSSLKALKADKTPIYDVPSLEMYKPSRKLAYMINGVEIDSKDMLEQKNIDTVVDDFFKERPVSGLPNNQMKELKRHIDKQIKVIQS